MAEERKKIAIFEDNTMWSKMIEKLVAGMGYEVVAIAESMEQALNEVIPQLTELGVAFVFIDGNLSPDESEGNEGKIIFDKVKQIDPSIVTIGLAGEVQEYVDRPMGKKNFDRETLKQALTGS